MVSRSQDKQRRFIVNLTETEVGDVIWAMEQGVDQMSYVDPEGDYGLSEAEWSARIDRVAAAIFKLTDALEEQKGEVWP